MQVADHGLRWAAFSRGVMLDGKRRLGDLAQTDDPAIEAKAREAAERLGLEFEKRVTGYGDLTAFIEQAARR